MIGVSRTLRTAALTGLIGVGAFATTATAALAHYSYVRCDNDGDTCWRVVCDDDGDDCNRVSTWHRSDYDRRYWNGDRRYWNGYYGNNGVGLSFSWGNGYYRHRDRSCDEDGDRCRWSDDDD